MSKELAIKLDDETRRRLSFIKEVSSVNESGLAERAIREFSIKKERHIKAVRQGQDDIRTGKVTSHEDLIKELESRIADLS